MARHDMAIRTDGDIFWAGSGPCHTFARKNVAEYQISIEGRTPSRTNMCMTRVGCPLGDCNLDISIAFAVEAGPPGQVADYA